MPEPLRLLLIEDSDNDALLLLQELARAGWQVSHQRVENEPAMIDALKSTWDIIVSDYSMPRFTGIAALATARVHAPDLPFILVSGTVGEEIAVQAMKAGANDYLFKGNLKRLGPAIERELREAKTRRQVLLAQEELRRRDAQLAEAQRLARLGSWHIEGKTDAVTLSEESCRILGKNPQASSVPFGEFLDCIHPDDRTLLSDVLHAPDIARFSRDLRITRKNGELRHVHIRGDISRDPAGWASGATGMIQDITERKLSEQELQKAHDALAIAKDAADAGNRTKDRFLAILSHELRTPLTPIMAIASHVARRRDLPAEVLHDLETIRRNVTLEARIVDDLLDLTRIVRSKMELHYEVADVHAILRAALDVFAKEIDTRRLEIATQFTAAHRHVWADPARLQQIFMNLISNAVKFTPAQGHISLSTRDHLPGRLLVEIRDTGIGFDPDMLPRLFNSFEQGERTITRRFGGLGLGLSIAQALARMQNGQVTAQSPGSGKGASFFVDLPTVPEPQPAAPAAPAQPPATSRPLQTSPKRILLVEDHEDTRRVMTRLLESSGCTVASAGTVQDARALADSQPFDLLVSDIGLPDGTGLEVMRHVQARQKIRGIALSGFGQEEDLRRSRDAGFEMHLTKPVDFHALLAFINAP